MRKIKLEEIFVKKYRAYLIIIFLMLVFICIKWPIFTLIATLIYMLILFFTYKNNMKMRKRVLDYMNEFIFGLNLDSSVLEFPIPATIVSNTGDILWNNEKLENLFKGINKQKYIENLIKELHEELDPKFPDISKEITIHDKHYKLLGNVVNDRKRGEKPASLMLYFIDITEYYKLMKTYEDSQDCVGLIVIDNYDELIQTVLDTEKPNLGPTVERKLREWFAFTGGIFVELDRNRFLIVFERKYIKAFTENKFEILDVIKEISFSNKVPVTISIGIVADEGTKYEKLQSAISAIDIALGRGGDQAVIKKDGKYEFFGGKSKELEKRTKVKSRVVAQALKELIEDSKNVIIMGHKAMDADALGASIGIHRLAANLNKEAYIVFNNYGITIEELLKKLAKESSYNNLFITTQDAINRMDQESLLVIVDTHKKDLVEAEELFDKTNKVVVIDHHRRSTEFISDATLTFHEVYASSASELVTEILQYADEKVELPVVEAECLYAGILTDTKNFTYKTGVRTFEAAAFLRKKGVDVSAIKKMFQNDVDTYVAIADVIRNSEIVFENIAIALCPNGINNPAQITAQAADELLNLNSIEASFVLAEINNSINISGRSNGEINVQTVLEQLGGGGHMMVAGAQVSGVSIDEAKKMLIKILEEVVNANE